MTVLASSDYGTVVEVSTVTLGDELASAHSAGVTTLTVKDAADFTDSGGWLTISAERLYYTEAIDDEDNDVGLLTLESPLAGSYAEGERVLVDPPSFEKFAQVMIGDFGEAQQARVPFDLWEKFPDQIWTDGEGPFVQVELVGDEFVIADVPVEEPVIDGAFIDPATLPASPPPPVVAPTLSPTPMARGGVRSVLVDLPPVFNESAIQAEVYVSTATPVTVAPVNLHGLAESTQYQFYDLPDGTPLVDLPEGTTIYVVVRGVNSAGEAPVSAESSAVLRKIDQEDFTVGYLYAGEIQVDQLTGGDFVLGAGTVTRVEARGINGEVVGMAAVDGDNPNGFYSFGAPESAGQQGPVRVHFPVDGKPNIVSGQSEFDELTTKSATLQGVTTIAPGGKVLLGGQVQAPKQVPSALPTWHTVQHDTAGLGGVTLSGLTKGHDGRWYSAGDDGWVHAWNDNGTGHTGTALTAGYVPLGGIVYASHHGGRYYLLVRQTSTNIWHIEARDTSFALLLRTSLSVTWSSAALGWDHVGGRLAWAVVPLGGSVSIYRDLVDAAGNLSDRQSWESPAGYSYDFDLGYVARVSTEYGDRYVFRAQAAAGGDQNFQVFTTAASPVRQTSEEWPRAQGNRTLGGWYDGSRFWSLDAAGKRYRYEGGNGRHVWTSGSAVREVQVTWRSNAGGYETTPSAKASVTMPKRARLSVTTPAIPTGSGPNYPDAARIYVGVGSGVANGSMNLEKTITAPATAWSTDTTVAQESPTTHPPTTNNFPNADPSAWEATSGGARLDSASNGSVGTGTFRDSIYPAWTTYTPAWTASTTNPTLGNGSISGRYARVGKRVDFVVVLNIGSTTSLGAGTYSFSLPVAARSADEVVVVGNQGGPNAGYTGRGSTDTTVVLYRTANDNVANPANTAFASGSHLRISGTYEAA